MKSHKIKHNNYNILSCISVTNCRGLRFSTGDYRNMEMDFVHRWREKNEFHTCNYNIWTEHCRAIWIPVVTCIAAKEQTITAIALKFCGFVIEITAFPTVHLFLFKSHFFFWKHVLNSHFTKFCTIHIANEMQLIDTRFCKCRERYRQ